MAQAVIGPVSRWHDSGIVGVGPGLWYGPTALDGTAGDWKRAPLGSIYVQINASAGTAQTWQKVAAAGTTADWKAIVDQLGVAGGQTFYGGTAANEDLTLEGTSNATKTTSYVILQPTVGNVGVNTMTPLTPLHVAGAATITGGIRPAADGTTALTLCNAAGAAALTVDTTNQRVGIAATPLYLFHAATSTAKTITTTSSVLFLSTNEAAASNPFGMLASINGGSTDQSRSVVLQTTTYGIIFAGQLHLQKYGGTVGIGVTGEATTALHVAANESLAGNTTDDYSAALTLDPAYTGDGIVTTVTLNAGGTGYTANDVITVVQSGGAGCTVTVNTVDGSGVITGITLLAGGAGYEVANALATTGGTGSGGKINITVLTARTVTRHNYIDVNQLALTKGAAVTGAALLRFDANAGTHKALLTGSTKTTPTGVDAWIPINANGTIMYIPVYASTTA